MRSRLMPEDCRYAVEASQAQTAQSCRTATEQIRLKARRLAVGESVLMLMPP